MHPNAVIDSLPYFVSIDLPLIKATYTLVLIIYTTQFKSFQFIQREVDSVFLSATCYQPDEEGTFKIHVIVSSSM